MKLGLALSRAPRAADLRHLVEAVDVGLVQQAERREFGLVTPAVKPLSRAPA
jgi:hypothetical protein